MPRLGGLEHPAAVGRDADRHHVVLLRVERRDHAPGRDAGDRVLARTATEDDGDARLATRAESHAPDPTGAQAGQYAGDMRPATQAVHLGRPPHEPDQPLNTPDHDGLDVRRRRRPASTAATPTPRGPRSRRRWAGSRAGAAWRSRAGWQPCRRSSTSSPTGRRWSRRGTPTTGRSMQLGDLELRERVTAALRRHHRHRRRRGGLRGRVPGLARVADQPGDGGRRHRRRSRKAAHEAGAYVVVDNTFATPILQQPLELGVDLVVHSATKYIAGHSDVLMGAVVTRDDAAVRRAQGPARPVRRDPRDLRGVARAARTAHPARCGSSARRPTPRSWYAASASAPTSPRSATRASAG